MGLMMPPPTAEQKRAAEDLYELVRSASKRFEALPPEIKVMHVWAQKISWVYGELGLDDNDQPRERSLSKEQVARMLLTNQAGGTYASEMLADPRFRQVIGIE